MGMRSSATFITPCELIREINDLLQGENHKLIRQKLHKLEKSCKLMSTKIYEHDTEWHGNTWIEENRNELQDWQKRINKNYKIDKCSTE